MCCLSSLSMFGHSCLSEPKRIGLSSPVYSAARSQKPTDDLARATAAVSLPYSDSMIDDVSTSGPVLGPAIGAS